MITQDDLVKIACIAIVLQAFFWAGYWLGQEDLYEALERTQGVRCLIEGLTT